MLNIDLSCTGTTFCKRGEIPNPRWTDWEAGVVIDFLTFIDGALSFTGIILGNGAFLFSDEPDNIWKPKECDK